MRDERHTVRRHPRYEAHAPMIVQQQGVPSQRTTQTVNLSVEGAEVCLINDALNSEVPLRLDIHLGPAHGELVCHGSVRWAERASDGMFHFGVQFDGMSEADQRELQQYLSKKSRQHHPYRHAVKEAAAH